DDADADIVPLLGALVRQSLVLREDGADDGPRFRLLETIRSFAATRLRAQPYWDLAAGAQAAAMQRAVAAAGLAVRDTGFDARLRRLELELPNLRLALDWLQARDPAGSLGLLDALGSFWALCGYGAEGLARCEVVLAGYPARDLRRCRVVRLAAWIATNLGEFSRADAHLAEASGLADFLADSREQAYVAFVRGNVAQGQGRLAEAEAHLNRALRAFTELAEPWVVFATQAALAMVALEHGDAALAETRYVAALRLAGPDGAPRDRAAVLCNIAVAQRWQGKSAEAVTHAARALALTEDTVAWSARAGALQVLARVALREGDLVAARGWMAVGLRYWQRSGDQWGLATSLEGVAAIAAADGDAVRAAALLGAVAALRERLAAPASAYGAAERAELEAALREALGTIDVAVATERGRGMPLVAALDLARTLLAVPA
ncbi:MAG: hypothetical protein KC442_18735, partial [Thermomicrobiales bacterium]|nr:hypothetical protein [Thermomicrobiales bacterium]